LSPFTAISSIQLDDLQILSMKQILTFLEEVHFKKHSSDFDKIRQSVQIEEKQNMSFES